MKHFQKRGIYETTLRVKDELERPFLGLLKNLPWTTFNEQSSSIILDSTR